jgi:periplasmic protein TonB
MRSPAIACVVVVLSAVVASGQSEKRVYVLSPGSSGISRPVEVKEVRPTYTREARAARVEGTMRLDVTVRPNGRAGDVMLVESDLRRSAGPASSNPSVPLTADEITKLGLDRAAIDAVRRWVWKPGMEDATPVAVRIAVTLTIAT